MAQVSGEMLVDSVDRNDTPIGVVRRNEVFTKHVNFRVAHVLVFNSSGKLLVQQLARTRTRHPGYWGSSVAAYLFSGETYQAAARRRLAQELGIEGALLREVGRVSMMEDSGCQKFIGIFATNHDGPFTFDPDHIEAVEFLSLREIGELHAAGSRPFTPTFLRVLDFYESRM